MRQAFTESGAGSTSSVSRFVRLRAVSELALDSTFADCRIEGVAGRGGMGVVYRATQHPLGRTVALKVVAPERAADPTFHARFERETRVAAAIDHPNVIPVYEAGEQDGRLYLVMRWVDGGDLQGLIAASGGLEPALAAGIVAQVGSGLEAAHAAGLVHRDVKPANVLIAAGEGAGHVYLTDFGLTLDPADTRLTQTGDLLGTVEFMAPEQLEGDPVSARTDVYALGCVLHAALTGRPPFSRGTFAATMLAHLGDPPPRPSETPGVPAAFDAVIARALAKRPEDRFSSARELVDAALAAAGTPAEARPPLRAAAPPARNGGPGAVTTALPATTAMLPPDRGGDEVPEGATARIGRAGRTRSPRTLAAGAAALAAVAGLAVLLSLDGGPFDSGDATGPLSAGEVRAAADSFAAAYASEDDDALTDLLSRDVARITPGDTQRGRAAVLREYRGQFAANVTQDYRLTGLAVHGGAAGRASGRYVASRSGAGPITGEIVLGVRRDRGQPRVGLIAVTPDG